MTSETKLEPNTLHLVLSLTLFTLLSAAVLNNIPKAAGREKGLTAHNFQLAWRKVKAGPKGSILRK